MIRYSAINPAISGLRFDITASDWVISNLNTVQKQRIVTRKKHFGRKFNSFIVHAASGLFSVYRTVVLHSTDSP